MNHPLSEMQLPSRTRVAAKYVKIADDLREQIFSGKLEGMLPGVRQIAEDYEVTLMTANKAVNKLVEEKTLYRIPNKGTFVAKGLPVKTNAIAVLVNDLNLPLTSRIVREMGMAATEFNTRLIFYQHFGLAKNELELAKRLKEQGGFDGTILFPSEPDDAASDALNVLRETQRPTIVFPHQEMPGWKIYNTVRVDHRVGFAKGTEYLISLGHTNIALALPEDNHQGMLSWQNLERQEGYTRALKTAGLQVYEPVIISSKPDLNELKKRLSPCTAVFAHNDSLAARLLTILYQIGIRVPQDISLLSYDGAPFTKTLDLSTMSQPMEVMGRKAFDKIIEMDEGAEPAELIFEAELVERGSTIAHS
ncbi:GntR family transcriptional regulator [Ruficoccus amylovorans]|nr:GntR family transcriptional regulator [Ruficoccus amylovorans]